MLPIIKQFLENYSAYLQPLYFCGAWVLLGLLIVSGIRIIRNVVKNGQEMRKIPCTDCQYFTNDYRLKCTIQPNIANTQLAVDCPDFIKSESNSF